MSRYVPKARGRTIKPIKVVWDKWARGLNTLVAPAKIRDDELSSANNLILVDEGSPVRRPGTDNWGADAGGLTTQGFFPYYKSDGTKALVKIEDGFFKVWSSGLWTTLSAHTFATDRLIDAAILNDTLYLVNGQDPLTKYDGNTLQRFNLISAPSSAWGARGASLTSGQYAYTYKVTAESAEETGETDPSQAFTVYVNKQRDQWNPINQTLNVGNSITINWTPVTGAKSYNIYGVNAGDERLITTVQGQTVTSWQDLGTSTISQVFVAPTGNSTQGVKGNTVTAFKTSLLIAGDPDSPSRVHFSAGVDKPDSFLIGDGGGYIDVNKNSDDGFVTGLGLFQDKAVVGKERSMWSMDFTSDVIPSLTNIVQGIGCVSKHTLIPVENDLFFLGRKPGGGAALYILGNEPNYFDVLRTNEISSRVRPTLSALSPQNFEKAFAIYFDGRFILFYSAGGGGKNTVAMVYDRERLGFTYWNEGVNAIYPTVFYDEDGKEYLLYSDENDNRITQISDLNTTDKGLPIKWSLKTKESDLNDPFLYKRYKWINIRLRNVGGVVRVKLWTDNNTTAYTSKIQGKNPQTIWGTAQWSDFGFGWIAETEEDDQTANIITRRLPIGRQGTSSIARSVALEIFGEAVDSRAALLDVQIKARPKSENYYPRDEVLNS